MKKVVTALSRKWLNAQTWDRLLLGYDTGKMRVKEYCALHGVSVASYYLIDGRSVCAGGWKVTYSIL